MTSVELTGTAAALLNNKVGAIRHSSPPLAYSIYLTGNCSPAFSYQSFTVIRSGTNYPFSSIVHVIMPAFLLETSCRRSKTGVVRVAVLFEFLYSSMASASVKSVMVVLGVGVLNSIERVAFCPRLGVVDIDSVVARPIP